MFNFLRKHKRKTYFKRELLHVKSHKTLFSCSFSIIDDTKAAIISETKILPKILICFLNKQLLKLFTRNVDCETVFIIIKFCSFIAGLMFKSEMFFY